MKYEEIKTEKAFARTSIDLGDYVLNPYKGCFHKCLYCYVQTNKFFSKHKSLWQDTVFVKTDFSDKMQIEFPSLNPSPSKILIGASTEVYMPAENKYKLMRPILSFLNQKKIPYTILTKSHIIERDIDLLKQGSNPQIYLTINQTSQNLKSILEYHTTETERIWKTLKLLTEADIQTIIYISPAFPFFTDINTVIKKGSAYTKSISIETFNPILLNLKPLQEALQNHDSKNYTALQNIYSSSDSYYDYWKTIEEKTVREFPDLKIRFYINPFQSYYNNQYTK